MKKIISIFIAIVITLSLSSCSVSMGEKTISDIEFKNSQCVVNSLEGVEISKENEYKIITDYNTMTEFVSLVETQFNTSEVYENVNYDYSSYNFNKTVKKYNEEFFNTSDLIVIRRYHISEKPLIINSVDINNSNASVNATLETGGESASFYRYYFITINKGYLNKNSSVTLNTSSLEATTSEFENSAYFSKEYNYKLIKDSDYADSIVSEIKKFNLTPASEEYDTQTYEIGLNDCMFMWNGFSALITEKFIIIDDVQYKPDSELQKKIVELYNKTDSEIHKEERPEYETVTQPTTVVSTTKAS